MSTMTGGEAVAATLESLGVEHVFGIVSVHNLPIYDAIHRRGRITAICVRHEQGAAHAADGYARATGKLGVCITSTGPGAANAVPGLFEAGFASSPVLMITGQIESRYYGKGKGFLHEAERQMQLLAAVTRRAASVRRTEDIGRVLVDVVRDILTGRAQPGAVEIPIDLQYATADIEIPAGITRQRVAPPEAALDTAAEALASAHRPLLWAGGGVVAADASSTLLELVERLNAPVVTTIEGRGAIPEDHPLCLGAFTATPSVGAIIAEADVVLAVGTRFQASATRNWALDIPGTLIHLDADPAVIGRNYRPATPIVGDALLGLEGILKRVDRTSTDAGYAERATAASAAAKSAARAAIGADHAAIMDTIRELLPRDGPIVRDATIPAYLWADRLLPILEPRTSMRPASAAIGPGLALGVGASIGSGRPTVVIHGDGGIMLSIGELATAVQHRAPLVVCVFNDGGYGVIRSIQTRTFEGRTAGVDLATPDFAALGAAMGAASHSVGSAAEFRAAFATALATEGPTILDIAVDQLEPIGGLGRPRSARQ